MHKFTTTILFLALAGCSSGNTSGTSTTSGSTSGVMGTHSLGDGGFGPNCTPPTDYIGNNLNIGAYCTPNGGQCLHYNNLECATDLSSGQGNFCLSVGCHTDADCGDDACCTAGSGTQAQTRGCVPRLCVIIDGGACPPGM